MLAWSRVGNFPPLVRYRVKTYWTLFATRVLARVEMATNKALLIDR